jgi:hypothetical protein
MLPRQLTFFSTYAQVEGSQFEDLPHTLTVLRIKFSIISSEFWKFLPRGLVEYSPLNHKLLDLNHFGDLPPNLISFSVTCSRRMSRTNGPNSFSLLPRSLRHFEYVANSSDYSLCDEDVRHFPPNLQTFKLWDYDWPNNGHLSTQFVKYLPISLSELIVGISKHGPRRYVQEYHSMYGQKLKSSFFLNLPPNLRRLTTLNIEFSTSCIPFLPRNLEALFVRYETENEQMVTDKYQAGRPPLLKIMLLPSTDEI